MPGQLNLFVKNSNTDQKTNPMRYYGAGPEGKGCAKCTHFIVKKIGTKATSKCLKRGGAKTNHRPDWPACLYFDDKEA